MFIRENLHKILTINQCTNIIDDYMVKSIGIKEIIVFTPCAIVKGDVEAEDIPGL